MTRARRAIALALSVAAAAPFAVGAHDAPRPPRRAALFDLVESLPDSARVLVSFDYAPAFAAECQPAAEAILWHLLARGARAYLVALWPEGENAAARTLERVLAGGHGGKRYARDFLLLGFAPGGAGAVNALVHDLRAVVTADEAGAAIDAFEMMHGVARLADFDLVISVSAGEPGAKEWAQCAGRAAGVRIAAAIAAIDAPALRLYVPRQLAALSVGIAGAAEYESAIASRYDARRGGRVRAGARAASLRALHAAIAAIAISGAAAALVDARPAAAHRRRGRPPS